MIRYPGINDSQPRNREDLAYDHCVGKVMFRMLKHTARHYDYGTTTVWLALLSLSGGSGRASQFLSDFFKGQLASADFARLYCDFAGCL